MDNGLGIIFDGSGRRIQIYLGNNADLADLAADSGYLTSSGHIAFLPPGKASTYQGCLGGHVRLMAQFSNDPDDWSATTVITLDPGEEMTRAPRTG